MNFWTCSTSAAPSSLFHVPNGFANYIAQDNRQMSREYERETVYMPVCKARGAPVNHCASTTQGAQKSPMFNSTSLNCQQRKR